ncbi:MAG: hypothetical protein RSA24_02970 [Clostridia bacterium]
MAVGSVGRLFLLTVARVAERLALLALRGGLSANANHGKANG